MNRLNSRERVNLALKGQRADRPLFSPAIYEHKAALICKSASEVSQNAQLLEQAVLAEYEAYSPDILTIGIDIYNIEAQALGSTVHFPEADDAVPIIKQRILTKPEDVERLAPVNPEKDGRMPLNLKAATELNKKIGNEVYIRGSVSGPCSMAVELMGIEQFLIALIDKPDEVKKLLDFCTSIAIEYGRAFLTRGVEVCVFDSYAAPPLVSPQLFERLIFPHAKRLIQSLKQAGAELIAYILGGDTSVIAKHLFSTGADIVLSDFPSNVDTFLELLDNRDVLLRRNISPILIEQGPQQQLEEQSSAVATLAAKNPQLIVGTGVISYNTSVETVQAVKKMCLNYYDKAICQK
ncbi:MAG: uroporphyrinogen decarboxylase family protein [Planctomycetota bacterium]|jgi:uroporphyrinogen decarboxylase